MEFKGTKGKWFKDRVLMKITNESDAEICDYSGYKTTMDEDEANGLLISKAPEMLEMLNDVCENLALQLERLGVCGEGDGNGRKADADSYGGTELLYRAKQLIKEATELTP